MSVFTSISSRLWLWEPFRRLPRAHDDELGRHAQLFWLAIYTMPEAKLHVPGMIMGSVTALAEGCGFQPDLARACMDRLIEADLVEYDIERRLLRMTQLPDAGEYPRNDKVILSWWRRFQAIPPCPLRDAHVATLKWLLEEHVRETGKAPTEIVMKAWANTFGTISMPLQRRRGVRRMQQMLPFSEASSDASRDERVLAVVEQRMLPVGDGAVDNSADPEKKNQVVSSTRVQQEIGTGTGTGIPESGSGSGAPHQGAPPTEGDSGKPRLAIVPEGTPYGPEQMLRVLAKDSGGRFVAHPDESLWPALRGVVAHLCEHGVMPDGLALLSAWLGRRLAVEGTEGKAYLGAWWAAKPNAVLFAYQRAAIAERDAERERMAAEERSAELRRTLSDGPYKLQLT